MFSNEGSEELMANLKLKRLESLALRELSLWLIQQSKSDKLKEISITEVRITNDLSYMTIFFSAFKQNEMGTYLEELEHNKSLIRQVLASKIKARKMPELIFKVDSSLNYGNHIEEIINNLNK